MLLYWTVWRATEGEFVFVIWTSTEQYQYLLKSRDCVRDQTSTKYHLFFKDRKQKMIYRCRVDMCLDSFSICFIHVLYLFLQPCLNLSISCQCFFSISLSRMINDPTKWPDIAYPDIYILNHQLTLGWMLQAVAVLWESSVSLQEQGNKDQA